MAKVKEKELKEVLNLRPTGSKGWLLAPECVFCGSKNKMGVIIGEKGVSYKCFAGKCQKQGSIKEVLEKIGRTDLLIQNRSVLLRKKLSGELFESKKDPNLNSNSIPIPIGFTRLSKHPYLESRNFKEEQYKKYKVGICKGNPLYDNYIIFLIEEGGENKGHIGRHLWSKEKIDKINKKRKERGEDFLIIRYNNSKKTDFDKLVFGIDEISSKTKTLIIVEGITDKFNVEGQLNIINDPEIIVLAVFGKAISKIQMKKIGTKVSSNQISPNNYLMLDGDAIQLAKEEGWELETYLDNLKVCSLPEDSDPGELNKDQINLILEEAVSPINFQFKHL